MAKKKNALVHLYLYDWKSSKFTLIINLNEVEALLAKQFPPAPGVAAPKIKAGDTIRAEVFEASGNSLQIKEQNITNIDERLQEITFDALTHLTAGTYAVELQIAASGVKFTFSPKFNLEVPDPVDVNLPISVELKQTSFDYKPSEGLWDAIKKSRINFSELKKFVDTVLCKPQSAADFPAGFQKDANKIRLPFVNVDQYSLVKYAIDAYMRKALHLKDMAGGYSLNPLPYYQTLQDTLSEMLCCNHDEKDSDCVELVRSKRNGFMAIELIWSYWTEQAMLVQAMGAVGLRYQNIRGLHAVEPMMRFDTSPLLPLSDLLWGFIQDEQHRTTLHRRTFEYQHAYNLTLKGRAVPRQIGVDNRSQFLSSFHNLLHQASLFYKEFDDKTRNADAFPLLIALRDVHLLLAEGNHNAYFNMTYTTRHEMLTMQYLFSQPEMQVFLGGRPMMPVEPHIGALDTVKTIQGWDPMGTMHYYDLANTGEQILLSIRFGDWNMSMYDANDAGNWAIAFRTLISTYINAYRNVTMIDLSADAGRSTLEERAFQPSHLIERRIQLTNPQRRPAAPFAATAA
ncbi:MAG TPA: hypothetical protein DCF33_08555 [Saprospirales bacterium]|nr:hypothetical protein [Saprospirales bacterium]